MFSNSYNMFNIIMRHLCAYILVWVLSMNLYGALHIMCQHAYEHYIALCALGGLSPGISPVSVQLSLWVARLVATRGLGAYCPQYMLIVFMLQDSDQSGMYYSYVGLSAKVAYLHLVYSFCTLHFIECKQIVIILNTSSVSNLSVSIFFYSTSVILSNLVLAELCSSPCTLRYSRS